MPIIQLPEPKKLTQDQISKLDEKSLKALLVEAQIAAAETVAKHLLGCAQHWQKANWVYQNGALMMEHEITTLTYSIQAPELTKSVHYAVR